MTLTNWKNLQIVLFKVKKFNTKIIWKLISTRNEKKYETSQHNIIYDI